MKLIILRNNLLEGLFAVERSVGETSNLPILKNVLILATGGKIKIIATNLELAVIHHLSGKIIEEGKVCIPFSIFYNIVKNLTSERVELTQEKNNLTVKIDNYEAVIYGQNYDDFPIIPTITSQQPVLIFKNKIFRNLIAKVTVAAQYSEIRPEISGFLLRYRNSELKAVATDSFRLAEETFPPEGCEAKAGDLEAIIPLKTAQELLRIIDDDDSDINVYLDPHQILFKSEREEIISRIIDGQFPDYEAVIPKEAKIELTVNRQELMSSVKLTSVFTSRANDIVLKAGDSKKFLEVFAAESQLGENRSLVPIKMKGDKFSIIFNWRYLLDGLKIHEAKEVSISLNGPDKPAMIKSTDEPGLVYVLMPIKS